MRVLLAKLRPEREAVYRTATFAPMHKPETIGSIAALLSPMYRRNTIVHWIVGFLSLFCIHGLTGWLPTLVVASGGGVSSAFAYGTLVMLASVFGGIGMGWLADKLRSRIKAMIIGYTLASISMISVGIALGNLWAPPFVAALGFFIFGAQAVLNNYQVMCYRTEVRGTGMGVAVGLNRVGGIMGPMIIGIVATFNPSPSYTFGIFAVALALAAAIISLGRQEIASVGLVPAPEARSNEVSGAASVPAGQR